MNEHSISELLCAFLDGELEGTEAETLFYMIANSQELQTEMRRIIALNAGFRKELLAPPAHLRANIEQQIWSSPSAPSPVAALLKSRPFLMLISALCTFLLMLQFTGFPAGNRHANVSVAGKPAEAVSQAVTAPATSSVQTPIVGTVRKAGTTTRNVRPPSVPAETSVAEQQWRSTQPSSVYREAPIAEQQLSATEKEALIAADLSSTADSSPSIRMEAPELLQTSNAENADETSPAISSATDSATDAIPSNNDRMFALHLRGFAARSFPNPDVDPLVRPTLNNMGIGLSYRLDDENWLGVEVGQEYLLQRYFDTTSTSHLTIEQNYLAFWASATYRYTPDFGGALQPFVQTALGGTRTGPMARTMLGIEYRIGSIGIAAGVEGTLHLYRYRDIWYSTRKLGISSSLSFRF